MRILLIGNPAAGSGRGRERFRRAQRRLEELGADVLPLVTTRVGHARRFLSHVPADVDRVAACGGDGLVSECASALRGGALPLAIVPAGRGNDFARAVGVPLNIEAAGRLALEGRVRRVDLGLVNGRAFCTVAGLGLDAEVSRRARRSWLPLPGAGVYIVELLRALRRFRGVHLRLSADGRVVEGDHLLLAVANTPTYGGGFRVAPAASVTDGILDVCLIRAMDTRRALRLFPRVLHGEHLDLPEVTTFRCRELSVVAEPPLTIEADGEPIAATPATYSTEPGALPVVAER